MRRILLKSQKKWLMLGAAFGSGALFALGLVLSGMTDPVKVKGFLNVGGILNPERFGAWRAELAFVMLGGLLVNAVGFRLTMQRSQKPWFAEKFELPTRTDIDKNLLAGAALFGCGWGLAGYCPGPALASLLVGGAGVVQFVCAMLFGMWLAKKVVK
jgi:uncharacterized membrane protein YedE/YeeE